MEESDLVGPAHDKLKVNEIMADQLVTLMPVMKAGHDTSWIAL